MSINDVTNVSWIVVECLENVQKSAWRAIHTNIFPNQLGFRPRDLNLKNRTTKNHFDGQNKECAFEGFTLQRIIDKTLSDESNMSTGLVKTLKVISHPEICTFRYKRFLKRPILTTVDYHLKSSFCNFIFRFKTFILWCNFRALSKDTKVETILFHSFSKVSINQLPIIFSFKHQSQWSISTTSVAHTGERNMTPNSTIKCALYPYFILRTSASSKHTVWTGYLHSMMWKYDKTTINVSLIEIM